MKPFFKYQPPTRVGDVAQILHGRTCYHPLGCLCWRCDTLPYDMLSPSPLITPNRRSIPSLGIRCITPPPRIPTHGDRGFGQKRRHQGGFTPENYDLLAGVSLWNQTRVTLEFGRVPKKWYVQRARDTFNCCIFAQEGAHTRTVCNRVQCIQDLWTSVPGVGIRMLRPSLMQ